jgi:hypothetical protein
MHVLFANTGVQIVCVPLPAGRRYNAAQIGNGWQHCRLTHPVGDSPEAERDPTPMIPYVQWQILQGPVSKLLLAVDTTLGDPHAGHFADAASMAGDFVLAIGGLVGASGEALAGIPRIELCLRAATATAGEAKAVHMIVDFGNSRTGALLLEVAGEVTQSFQMQPFELPDRYALDAWDNAGQPIGTPADRWFSSRTHWCNTPYRTPPELSRKSYHTEMVKGLLGSKEVVREYESRVKPDLFRDFSQARLGREGDHVAQLMTCNGDFRTGLSSPKRYLWADDGSWLEGAFWYMADPNDRCGTGTRAAKLQGPLLTWLHEDDRDFLLDPDAPAEDQAAPQAPVRPRHAPRTMMVVALYELLCQAYAYANSLKYRTRTTDSARAREIRSLTMTFPTGMLQVERERFRMQAEKAIQLFNRTLGRQQKVAPKLTFSIDEASAVHLTFIWSELQMLGQDAGLWFNLLGRRPDAEPAPPARRFAPQAAAGSGPHATQSFETSHQALRIACIDIGGGSTDLMIAEYRYQPGIDDSIEGRVLHRDGMSIAGDQLIKRLLEKVIIPTFAQVIGFEDEDVQLLFGPEVPNNRGMAPQRIDWMNRLFLPLAEAYLQLAVDGSKDVELSHTDPQLVDPAVLETLDQACVKLRGPGYYNIKQDLRLTYDSHRLEEAVHEVFDDLLFDICSRIVDHQADVVLLAGQPTKLAYMQDLVRRYVPLPDSRIVPMFQHYAGNWYPYQDVKGHSPGLIVDPKSAVVVGAAIEFLARHGLLPQFRFKMRGADTDNSYYWGVMSESTGRIRPERLLFQPASDNTRGDGVDFTTIAQRALIGRKIAGHEDAQANPVYLLKMEVGDRIGPTEVTVRIRRQRADDENEEHLELESVSGTVAGEPAVLGENVHFQWRTLGNDRFFLDTGGLDNIELPQH